MRVRNLLAVSLSAVVFTAFAVAPQRCPSAERGQARLLSTIRRRPSADRVYFGDSTCTPMLIDSIGAAKFDLDVDRSYLSYLFLWLSDAVAEFR
jgi:hypothetical protein